MRLVVVGEATLMIRFFFSKRGISYVLIVALLIFLAMAVGFSAYLWMLTVQRAGHAIQIQNVYFGASSTIIYVQNVGDGTVTIVSVHIDGEKFNVDSTNSMVGQSNTNIVPEGSTAQITISRVYTSKVYVKVVCSDGTSHEGYYKPSP